MPKHTGSTFFDSNSSGWEMLKNYRHCESLIRSGCLSPLFSQTQMGQFALKPSSHYLLCDSPLRQMMSYLTRLAFAPTVCKAKEFPKFEDQHVINHPRFTRLFNASSESVILRIPTIAIAKNAVPMVPHSHPPLNIARNPASM